MSTKDTGTPPHGSAIVTTPSATEVLITRSFDARVGGRWRCVTREEDGTEVGFHGEYARSRRRTGS
jgi:hypothetical protein